MNYERILERLRKLPRRLRIVTKQVGPMRFTPVVVDPGKKKKGTRR